jgi:hypothetical protein
MVPAVKSFITAYSQVPRNTLVLAQTFAMKDTGREAEIPPHINTTAKPSISHLSPKLRVATPDPVEDVNMWRDVFAGNPDFMCFLCHFTRNGTCIPSQNAIYIGPLRRARLQP